MGVNQHIKIGTGQFIEAGQEIHLSSGMKVVLEAGSELTLKGGGSFIKIDASGVTLSGPVINMNSGESGERHWGCTADARGAETGGCGQGWCGSEPGADQYAET